MSMARIAYTFNGETKSAILHYAQAILNWRKYHEESAAYHEGEAPDSDFWRDYYRKQAAFHRQAAQGYTADIDLGGCEKDAGDLGFWVADTDEAAAAWVSFADKWGAVGPVGNSVCHIDFDAKTLTAPAGNPFCRWWDYLPDGWTAKVDGPDADCADRK